MSNEGPQRPSAGFQPVLVEVPIFDEGELLEAEQAYDNLVAAGIAARSITRKLKRRIDAARARFSEPRPPRPPPRDSPELKVVTDES